MTVSTMELKVNAIHCDVGLSRNEKIAKLEALRNAARALQRALLECSMPQDDRWYEDIYIVEIELEELKERDGHGKTVSPVSARPV